MTETVTVQVGDRLVFDIDVPDEQGFAQWLYATVVQKYPTRARGGKVSSGGHLWVNEGGFTGVDPNRPVVKVHDEITWYQPLLDTVKKHRGEMPWNQGFDPGPLEVRG